MYYARLGLMTIKSGQEREVDMMLRRSHFKFEHGLHGQLSREQLEARSISAADRKALIPDITSAPTGEHQQEADHLAADEADDDLPAMQQELFAC